MNKFVNRVSRCTQKKGTLLWWSCLAFIIIILTAPAQGADFVRKGVEICLVKVLPTLFPFALLSSFLCTLPPPRVLSLVLGRAFGVGEQGAAALISGIISGFPVGALCVSQLYRTGRIHKDEAQRMLCFANNPSPAFVIGVIGGIVLQDTARGVLLFAILTLFSWLQARVLHLFRDVKDIRKYCSAGVESQVRGSDPTAKIKECARSMLNVAAFIVTFTVIGEYVKLALSRFSPTLTALACGAVELSGGVLSLAQAAIDSRTTFALCGALCSFSGLSVHMQVKSALSGTDLSLKKYCITRMISPMPCALVCYYLYDAFSAFL